VTAAPVYELAFAKAGSTSPRGAGRGEHGTLEVLRQLPGVRDPREPHGTVCTGAKKSPTTILPLGSAVLERSRRLGPSFATPGDARRGLAADRHTPNRKPMMCERRASAPQRQRPSFYSRAPIAFFRARGRRLDAPASSRSRRFWNFVPESGRAALARSVEAARSLSSLTWCARPAGSKAEVGTGLWELVAAGLVTGMD